MTTKDKLHRLVDVLPDADADTAARVLEALAAASDPVALACALAPDDDEPTTAADRAALAERAHTAPDAYVPLAAALAQLDADDDTADDAAPRGR